MSSENVTTFTGSCLCGQVSYQVVGDAQRFFHCHCGRCRKATGSSHATNLLLAKPVSAEFTQGEAHITRYRLPNTARFGTCFCTTCGSKLPRIAPDMSLVVIPAGSLDHDIEAKPQARIFYADRSAWSCLESDLPTFTKYPT